MSSTDVKICRGCGSSKPISEFRKRQSLCKPCHSASVVEWQRNNRERTRAKSRRWYKNNREKARERGRQQWKDLSPEKKRKKYDRTNARHKIALYGITISEIDDITKRQNGACAICGKPPMKGRWKKLVVDHDHATGRIRGLLCSPCNVGLGALGDTVETIERALNYLRAGAT